MAAAHYDYLRNHDMDKDFAWLCSAFVAGGVRVPVPETVFLWKEEVVLWVSIGPNGDLKRLISSEDPITMPGEVVHYFATHRETAITPATIICTANVKGTRIAVTEEKLEEVKTLRGLFSRCSCFQRPIGEKLPQPIYVLSVDLQDGKYNSEFRVHRGSPLICRDQRLYFKLLVYMKIALRTVESVRRRRVAQMGLEFYVGEQSEAWLIGCTHLRLQGRSTPGADTPEAKMAEETLKAGDSSPKWRMADEKKPRSNRLPQLRITTPYHFLAEPREGIETAEVPMSANNSNASQHSRTSPQPPLAMSRSSRPVTHCHTVDFHNPHFKEIIARTYARGKNWLIDDLEAVFKDMDLKMLQEDEPVLRRGESLLKRSNSGPVFTLPETTFNQRRFEEIHKVVFTEATADTKPTAKKNRTLPQKRRGKLPSSPRLSSVERILSLYSQRMTHRKMRSLPELPKIISFTLKRE